MELESESRKDVKESKHWFAEICKESSVHGMPYLAKKELHWSERLFWLLTLIAAAYYSINVCLNQWERFRNNPIVYAMELTFGIPDFPYAGITLCSSYLNENDMNQLIQKTWDVSPKDTNASAYYKSFLDTLNTLHADTLFKLEPYENDTTLKNLNFLDILLTLKSRIMPVRYANLSDAALEIGSDIQASKTIYAAAITETGLCRTTSQLNRFTNPYGEIKHQPVSNVRFCGTIFREDCNTKIFPMVNTDTALLLHIHNVYDIVTPNERSTISRNILPYSSLQMELLLGSTRADASVRNLPIAYRKCRYPDENNLKYFDLYRPSLCRSECHIDEALKLCNCKPYFYAVGPKEPMCDIKGLMCLWRKEWLKTACQCVPLCEEISYVSLLESEQNDGSSKFERTIITKLLVPKMAYKRNVVFSTDQLIMSFGGAVGLFLGASFMSIYNLIYIFLEYTCTKFCKSWHQYRHKKRIRKSNLKHI